MERTEIIQTVNNIFDDLSDLVVALGGDRKERQASIETISEIVRADFRDILIALDNADYKAARQIALEASKTDWAKY